MLYVYVPEPPDPVTVISPSSLLHDGVAVASAAISIGSSISIETKLPQPFASCISIVCVPANTFEIVNGAV